ncbi:unnamed protein product [Rotaria sordida]|uniref:Uncharacterized protein n=1 Tax=Rotaria sordida TaxID=392033 RepID=A0A814LIG2_9BILA|nr:unnamed protein product [Rotaria sordida]CAF3705756.1 unnamed protein product [Rotaria sordida]
MADNLTDVMHREFNRTSSDTTNVNNNNNNNNNNTSYRSLPPHVVSWKTSNHKNNHNSDNNQHQHAHQQTTQSLPIMTTTDYSHQPSLGIMPASHTSSNRRSLNSGYDTDGAINTSKSMLKHHHKIGNGYEHLVSPRLPPRRPRLPSTKQVPAQTNLPQQTYLTVNPSTNMTQNYDDRDDELNHENDANRRHIRFGRRMHHSPSSSKNHGAHNIHSPKISRHDRILASTSLGQPLRLIFMRHSERANQALGSDWFIKAFRTGTYKAYDQNLPIILPKRYFDQAYEFDAPLTVRGLKNARQTGRIMSSSNLIVDLCLSSSALRCIQTCERILSGMNCRERIPIRIEPGLFECPHLNNKIVESFMTKKELLENGYNIKVEYKPLIQKINVPESLEEYFHRCSIVMHGIINRYANYGGTVLIVTHAPGLLALTDAIKGIRTNQENFYRTVAGYPPLAVYIAEFDGKKWKYSEQPFSIPLF